MKTAKTHYVCQACGYVSLKWMGKCPECEAWNTLVEEFQPAKRSVQSGSTSINKPLRLMDIEIHEEDRFQTGIGEFDRVLGGGIVPGSLTLVGGDPGIGKSTMVLQVAKTVAAAGKKVLYVSGEESTKQIKLRAERLGVKEQNVYLLAETDIEAVLQHVSNEKPELLIIDSIQTVYLPSVTSSPGSVSQVREVTAALMRMAKRDGIATFIIGHVTKAGAIAGPKILEHIVDTVLYFEGERHTVYRIVRSVKNRFGSTNEIGIFEMNQRGLEEVLNPSLLFLTHRGSPVAGSVTIPTIEGTRPVLVELQALVSQTNFGNPRRMAVGVDYNKMTMLMAVLEKRVGLVLHDQDGYVNVVGGMTLDEPAADLGIVCAIASSFRNRSIESDMVILGEVGLTGEVRPISQLQQRLNEALKLGFTQAIVPKASQENLEMPRNFHVYGVNTIEEAFSQIFGR